MGTLSEVEVKLFGYQIHRTKQSAFSLVVRILHQSVLDITVMFPQQMHWLWNPHEVPKI